MRINVEGRHLNVTDPIREHAETKGDKLTRYLDMIQQITFTIGQEVAAKEVFQVELVVDVEHHHDFISRAEGGDLYALIDEVSHKATRQLTDFKEKLKLGNR